jgi:hypothetical protein
MSKKNLLWFKAKTYGWGWTPATWQGWGVTVTYAVLVTIVFLQVDQTSHSIGDSLNDTMPFFVLSTVFFILICVVKGEKPGWRWGGKKIK